MNEYRCPDCKRIIPLEDINVANDIALCRICGKTTSFAGICDANVFENVSVQQPPTHVTVKYDLTGMGTGTVITYKRLNPLAIFVIPFTCVWAGGSMYTVYGMQIIRQKFELMPSLFGLPFLLGSIVLVSLSIFMLLGKWRITLVRGEGSAFVGVGTIGLTRRFQYNRLSKLEIDNNYHGHSREPQNALKITTGEQTQTIVVGLPNEALAYIGHIIKQEANRL